MERSTLLPAVLPGALCKTPAQAANDTYAALLRLFIYFMNHVRHRADQPPASQWRENEAQELILVHWKHENMAATVHFFIVHAQVCFNLIKLLRTLAYLITVQVGINVQDGHFLKSK